MAYKPPPYTGLSELARVLEKVTKPAFKKRGFAEQKVITDWPNIVGQVIATYSTPLKLVFPPEQRRDGVLHIEVYDSALATEIHYLGPIILDRIATYFGYRAVAQLKLTQKPMPWKVTQDNLPRPPKLTEPEENAIHTAVETIHDPLLQQTLTSLGQAIAASAKGNIDSSAKKI